MKFLFVGLCENAVEGVKVPEVEKEEGYVWLEERDKPEGIAVVGALYSGPKIVK